MNLIYENDIKEILEVGRRLLDGISFANLYSEELFERYKVLIFYKDSHSNFLGCNKRLSLISKIYDPISIIGKSDYDLVWTKDQSEGFRRDDQEVILGKKPKLDIGESLRQFDKTESLLLTSKFPIYSSNRKKIGVLGVSIDLSEYQLLEKELLLKEKVGE